MIAALLKIRFSPRSKWQIHFASKNNYITFHEPELFTAEFAEVKDNSDLKYFLKPFMLFDMKL